MKTLAGNRDTVQIFMHRLFCGDFPVASDDGVILHEEAAGAVAGRAGAHEGAAHGAQLA